MEVRADAEGNLTRKRIMHRPYLASIAADTPAGKSWSKTAGVAGYMACPYCLIQGVRDGATRFPGCLHPAMHGAILLVV